MRKQFYFVLIVYNRSPSISVPDLSTHLYFKSFRLSISIPKLFRPPISIPNHSANLHSKSFRPYLHPSPFQIIPPISIPNHFTRPSLHQYPFQILNHVSSQYSALHSYSPNFTKTSTHIHPKKVSRFSDTDTPQKIGDF